MLFMPQYAEPWKHRLLQSTIDAIRHYPEFPQARAHGMSASIIPMQTEWSGAERAVATARRRGR